jgi:hypothetical protein
MAIMAIRKLLLRGAEGIIITAGIIAIIGSVSGLKFVNLIHICVGTVGAIITL